MSYKHSYNICQDRIVSLFWGERDFYFIANYENNSRIKTLTLNLSTSHLTSYWTARFFRHFFTERKLTWPCPKWTTSCALSIIQTLQWVHVSFKSTRRRVSHHHFSIQMGALERTPLRPLCALDPNFCWGRTRLLTTVKAGITSRKCGLKGRREGV